MDHTPMTKAATDEHLYPFRIDGGDIHMALLAKVLKKYQSNGKTAAQFEEEIGCTLKYESGGISGIKFRNDSNKTMFMLKYKL